MLQTPTSFSALGPQTSTRLVVAGGPASPSTSPRIALGPIGPALNLRSRCIFGPALSTSTRGLGVPVLPWRGLLFHRFLSLLGLMFEVVVVYVGEINLSLRAVMLQTPTSFSASRGSAPATHLTHASLLRRCLRGLPSIEIGLSSLRDLVSVFASGSRRC